MKIIYLSRKPRKVSTMGHSLKNRSTEYFQNYIFFMWERFLTHSNRTSIQCIILWRSFDLKKHCDSVHYFRSPRRGIFSFSKWLFITTYHDFSIFKLIIKYKKIPLPEKMIWYKLDYYWHSIFFFLTDWSFFEFSNRNISTYHNN
jgi:hypothetical protein